MPMAILAISNVIIDDLEDARDKTTSNILKVRIDSALNKIMYYYTLTDNSVYAISTVLDPRFKLQYFIIENWESDWLEWVKSCLSDVYNEYKEISSSQDLASIPSNSTPTAYNRLTQKLRHINKQSEIDRYYAQDLLDISSTNILMAGGRYIALSFQS